MFTRQNLLIVVVAVIGAAFGLVASSLFNHPTERAAPPGVTVLRPGDQRVDLDLTDVSGKSRRLSEFDGKIVLLNFWASWCGPCREEMPLLNATRSKLAMQGFEVVGVAVDDNASVQQFLRENPVAYPILLSDDDDASLRFGDTASVLPFSVLIGRDGKLLAQRTGNFTATSLQHWLEPHLPAAKAD